MPTLMNISAQVPGIAYWWWGGYDPTDHIEPSSIKSRSTTQPEVSKAPTNGKEHFCFSPQCSKQASNNSTECFHSSMGYAGLQCGALFSDFRKTVDEECADSTIEVPRIVADSPSCVLGWGKCCAWLSRMRNASHQRENEVCWRLTGKSFLLLWLRPGKGELRLVMHIVMAFPPSVKPFCSCVRMCRRVTMSLRIGQKIMSARQGDRTGPLLMGCKSAPSTMTHMVGGCACVVSNDMCACATGHPGLPSHAGTVGTHHCAAGRARLARSSVPWKGLSKHMAAQDLHSRGCTPAVAASKWPRWHIGRTGWMTWCVKHS